MTPADLSGVVGPAMGDRRAAEGAEMPDDRNF